MWGRAEFGHSSLTSMLGEIGIAGVEMRSESLLGSAFDLYFQMKLNIKPRIVGRIVNQNGGFVCEQFD